MHAITRELRSITRTTKSLCYDNKKCSPFDNDEYTKNLQQSANDINQKIQNLYCQSPSWRQGNLTISSGIEIHKLERSLRLLWCYLPGKNEMIWPLKNCMCIVPSNIGSMGLFVVVVSILQNIMSCFFAHV